MLTIVRYVVAVSVVLSGGRAAAMVVVSPDEICPPSDDPCVIQQPYQTSTQFPLDFGLRKVVVTGAGRFDGGLALRCGSFEVATDGRWMQLAGTPQDSEATVEARRGCSLGRDTPCGRDSDCEAITAGRCLFGDGSIVLSGETYGVGTALVLKAVGDVTLRRPVRMSGFPEAFPNADSGGAVVVRSEKGSIHVAGTLQADAGRSREDGTPGYAGRIDLRAGADIRINRRLSANGSYGEINLRAGRDLRIRAPVSGRGKKDEFASGANLALEAGRDIAIEPAPGRRRLNINVRGGGDWTLGADAAPGGSAVVKAGRDMRVGSRVRIHADSGKTSGLRDDIPWGGDWEIRADGDLTFDGTLKARGRGVYAYSGYIVLQSGGDVSIGDSARLTVKSHYTGGIEIEGGERGRLAIHGRIDAGGLFYPGPRLSISEGGYIELRGGDLLLGGRVEVGGGEEGGSIFVDACRVHMLPGAGFDAGRGEQRFGYAAVRMRVRESMLAEPGSVLVVKPESGSRIAYRDVAKPPVLNGFMPVEPELVVDEGLRGCPVCGNQEIDEGETCDDGNLENGDGCDQTCQIADPLPGFREVPSDDR